MICFNRKNNLNKISYMVEVDIIKDIEIIKVIFKNICNIFFWLKFGIQLTQSRFK